jgi:hypothetical protein
MEALHSMVQERHLGLEMSSSERLTPEEEREKTHLQNNIKSKSEQLKLSKTDLSMWS